MQTVNTRMILTALAALLLVPAAFAANNSKDQTLPAATVIAHLPLPATPGGRSFLHKEGNRQYLYIQRAGHDGYEVVDVTKPKKPTVVQGAAWPKDDNGNLEFLSGDIALDESSNRPQAAAQAPVTRSVNVLDMSDPANPHTIQTFNGVTSVVSDDSRWLVYLTNSDGLWILQHRRPSLYAPPRPCTSSDAISAMPPDCY